MKLIINNQSVSLQNNSDLLYKNEPKEKDSFFTQYELNCYEKRKNEKKNNLKNIFVLILLCILNFFYITYNMIKYRTKFYKECSNGLIFLDVSGTLFAFALLSHFIIKNSKMYRHHYLSAIIILFVLIIINIFSFLTEKENNENYFLKSGLLIFGTLLFSIAYVCGTKYLYISKGNIYQLLFFEGIAGIILSILLQVITHFTIPCDKINHFLYNGESYCDSKKRLNTILDSFDFNISKIFISVLLIIVNFIESWLVWLLIIYFSVNHFCAIWSILSLFYLLIINENNEIKNYISILGCVIIIFAAFVFNEIIILRFCGLDKNTITEINRRSLRDSTCDFGNDEFQEDSSENYLNLQDGSEVISDENSKKY